ncbi:hypothetical protein NQ317_004725 [Molorchus minor]|uniref:K Homology domain-containing protein n=1 Tax=Molorchus minor TaxID=1323400 RepID=A0ABQ9JP11_9CUCU|nr:hypothetical protein NQ317_004725 [Molorchus minor]
MADRYESNGVHHSYMDNFNRREDKNINRDGENEEHDENNAMSQKAGEYVKELLAEKILLEEHKHPNATKLLEEEISKTQVLGRPPPRDTKYVDIYREKPIKVTVKVLVPIREHPKFNFVGKLLGPKGNSMKRLQEETMCKMAILGRGSMKDRQREEDLRQSLDPKYAHLSDELHVEISALGPPAEAHARIAYALAEVRKYLIPDYNDNIRMEQMREMGYTPGGGREMEGGESPRRPMPGSSYPGPPAMMRTATRMPVVTSRGGHPKMKTVSILDRARLAMEDSHGCDDPYYEPEHRSSGPPSRSYSSAYDPEYETGYSYKGESSSYGASHSANWKSYKTGMPPSTGHPSEGARYRTSPYSRRSK